MTFTAVVTSHDQDVTHILNQLGAQLVIPNEALIYWSGLKCLPYLPLDKSVIWGFWDGDMGVFKTRFHHQPNRNDWGHEKRDLGLRYSHSDYVGFFNSDDTYSPEYIKLMMERAEETGAGLVYCWWHARWGDMAPCKPELGSSTSGNFIVHRDIAREAGYWKGRHYEADGQFIEAAVAACRKLDRPVEEVGQILFRQG